MTLQEQHQEEGQKILEIKISDEYEYYVPTRMSDQEFRALVDHIRKKKQLVPGLVNQHGVILDGHNRYKACAQLGIPFRYEVTHCDSKADELDTIVETNVNRRQMTPFQRAELVLKEESDLQKLKDTARENMSLGGKGSRQQETLHVDERLAKKAHTSKDTIYKTRRTVREAERNPGVYGKLVEDLRKSKSKASLDKAYNRIKKDQTHTKRLEEVEAAAKGLNLPEKVILLNIDSTKVEDLPEIKDNSIDLIITDPPYAKEYLDRYEGLAKFASKKLKEGGSVVFLYGQMFQPEIHEIFKKHAPNLMYWWQHTVLHQGHGDVIQARRVRNKTKAMLEYVKGKSRLVDTVISDFIKSSKPDKDKHLWAQSTEEAEHFIKDLTVSEHSVVCDPFLGSGTFGIPAIKLNRWFIGIEIDKKTFENAKNNLIREAHGK